jgi:hypothetical protein
MRTREANQTVEGEALDFRDYYHLESYLFDKVRVQFAKQGYLTAFDFFCIVIWKANRAKSKIAKKLLEGTKVSLDVAVGALTYGITKQKTAKDRLGLLWNAGFRLPMASAILTVLYPDEFTMYDTRVCGILGGFRNLDNLSDFEDVWRGYQDFKRKVVESTPAEFTLRDKDRYLWGKSFSEQLTHDISQEFKNDKSDSS